ncbi:hypothetical protein BO71DRAFT_397439 [Aspergillus ellipticus CBS 707.79]|uniref:ATP phosphoribosyltransferase n=1 Tax=Aspergillus ellipticus CBS 707.79 TaxID=1448320 RepID=A0A319DFU0_9EURO|nr:hypothetical protein BO71DRAFT_397439 [Aspergillus ellipticus CBS 707.79]
MPPNTSITTLGYSVARTSISQPCRASPSYTVFRALSSSRFPLLTPLPASSSTRRTTATSTISHSISKPQRIPSASHIYLNRTMSSESIPDRYKLVFFVPHSHLEACKEAVFATGAGTFPGGKYRKCCFQMPGQGQFLPSEGANPAIGEVGTVETVEEMKVEVMCLGRTVMLQAVEALVQAHPYEEVAYEVYKMENV